MHTKNIRVFPASLLGAMLWLVPVSPLVFSACDAEPVKVSVTMEADYSQIIEAIQGTSQTLTAKMALIESALSQGFADDNAAQELLRQAVSSLTGTAEDKLGAVETAVRNGTASLETKLGLIEAAVAGGFADGNAQLALIQTAIASLSGSLAEKLAAVETAVKSQTTSLSTKLGVIETALTEGLADEKKAQALLHQAVEALEGTAAERLLAIEQAVDNQASSLATKLGLIDAALEKGLADNEESLLLIGQAVAALDSTMDDRLQAIEAAVKSGATGLETKLGLIEAAVAGGFADHAAQQTLMLQALQTLGGTMEAKLAAVETAVRNQASTLATKLGLIDAAIRDGFLDQKAAQGLIREAVATLGNKAADSLWAIDTAVSSQTLALWTKLELIEAALASGLTDEATALGGIERALRSMQQGNVSGIVTKIQAIKTTLEGKVARGLSDLFTAIDTLADYREILVAINQAVYNMTDHSINGHDYVEMSPGLKWATMNVGAIRPEESGGHYAWGELAPKSNYSWQTYKFWTKDPEHTVRDEYYITKYTFEDGHKDARWYNWDEGGFCGDGVKWLGAPVAGYDFADDVARQDWGASWRMPTYDEWAALCDTLQYEWKWTDNYSGTGVAGMLVTSWVAGCEGSRIFLPAAGWMDGSACKTDWNGYWSSSLVYVSYEAGNCYFNASGHHFYKKDDEQNNLSLRCMGLLVRPVTN